MVQKLKKLLRPKGFKQKAAYSLFAVLIGLVLILTSPFGGSRVSAAQFGRPSSDITVDGFSPTPLYSRLNETSPDGTTSEVTVANNGGDKTPEVALSAVTDPVSSTGHIMSIYIKKSSNRTSAVTMYLYQGATLIASSSAIAVTTTYTQYDYTLSGAEADSITDYSDLRMRVFFDDQGGGAPGTFNWSWAQLQVPDLPNFTEFGYRWRSDDGNETTGSSLANENTTATIAPNTNVRVRFSINNTGGSQPYSYRLEYTTAPAGVCSNTSWTVVPDTPTIEAFDMVATTNYSDQAASTNASSGPGVLTDPGGSSFTAGKLVRSTSNTATSVTVDQNQFTELEYALQANSNASQPTYCFRVTNAGANLNTYSQFALLNVSYPPLAPVIYSPLNGATNVSVTPMFQLRGVDSNNDYLKYSIEECPTSSWPCGGGGHTYDQTSSQTCWSGQDVQSASAYQANAAEYNSSMAYCTMPSADFLSKSTTYYFRARAIDPGGSNSFGPYTSTFSFTTGSLEVLIRGGTTITGGTYLANPFPITTVLDNFNRAGTTSPPSGSWTASVLTSLTLQLSGDSATAKVSGAGNNYGGALWNPENFGPDTEVFVTIPTLPAAANVEVVDLYARMVQTGSSATIDGYQLEALNNTGNNIMRIQQTHNGSNSQVGTDVTQAIAAGDSVGIRVTGSGANVTIDIWYKPAGKQWRVIKTVTDGSGNRITTGGLIGLETYDNSARYDDFGGGTMNN